MTNIKIYYIYFPNEKLGEYIRNESNNENWPTASKYLEISKDYFQQINQWKQAEENNEKVKEIIANIQKWFRMEGLAILDSKEPIRTYKIEDIRPLLKETDFSKISNFYLRYYNRIDALIGGWGSGFDDPGAGDILESPSAVEMPVELAIAYQKQKGEIPLETWETRKGLAQYIKELEAKLAKEEEIITDPGTVQLPSAVPKPKIFDAELEIVTEILDILSDWKWEASKADLPFINEAIAVLSKNVGTKKEQWKIISDLSFYTGEYPTKLNDYLQQWELLHNHSEEDEKRKKTTIIDNAVKSYRELAKLRKYLEDWKKLNGGKATEPHNSSNIWVRRRDGEKIIFHWKVPNQKFNEINNYLFYFYGEWREPVFSETVDYETVQITASFSQFYNHYWHLLKSEVNGIIEHSPLIREEVCECPDFNSTPAFADFTSDYQLPLGLFRAKGNFVGSTKAYSSDPRNPAITTLQLERATNDVSMGQFFKELWDQGIGTCFFVLGERYDPATITTPYFHGNNKWENNQIGDIHKWLKSYGLLETDMEEILMKHIKATIYWRDKHVWQGNYWLLHNQFYIKESINPAGNSINICGNGMVITKLTESITAKIGGNAFVSKFIEASIDMSLSDEKGQNNRQTERAIISDNKKISEDHWQTRTAEITKLPGGGNNKASRMWRSGTGFLQPNLYNVDHTKSEYTMDQFLHRNWFVEDNRPLKLRVEVDQKLINWYRNKRELIGKTGQDFYNGSIANLLNVPGYLQMKVLTSNFPFNNWFRNKLERGINLWETDPKEFYQKKLSNPMAIASIGDIRHNAFEVITITNTITIIGGKDDASHLGRGLWVYKDSYAKTVKGVDLLPWLMESINNGQGTVISGGNHKGCIHQQDNSKWVFIHPQDWEVEFIIPSQYLTNERTYQGQGTVKIDYYFNFFSSKDKRTGQELFANKFIVKRDSAGNTGTISIQVIGNHKLINQVGGSDGIPPTTPIPGAGITPTITDPEPFDPTIEIPQSVIGDPTAPVEPVGSHIEVPIVPEIPAEPIEPPVDPIEPPAEPKEPIPETPLNKPAETIPEKPLENNDDEEDK